MIVVMNTLNGFSSEWNAPITSVSGNTAGGDRLFAISGDTDDSVAIDARFVQPQTDQGTSKRKRASDIYLEGVAEGFGDVIVIADGEEYQYPIEHRDDGITRAKAGKGIFAHRLAFGYANRDGADFRIESLDPQIHEATSRRIS